ncbi:hypothetical protein [Clostridium sp. C8-1-8]|uniref:hypothetical protein n=1 Tax=Clostridium sp. C8-1-8 TaxID=2698831 RepID=UPI00136A7F6C|nr:hypothetical protein [Clostridium sp. C8-1-8]
MSNKGSNNKVSLNDKLINIINFISIIVIIFAAIFSIVAWKKKDDIFYIISGVLIIGGTLFNIYLYSRQKLKEK